MSASATQGGHNEDYQKHGVVTLAKLCCLRVPSIFSNVARGCWKRNENEILTVRLKLTYSQLDLPQWTISRQEQVVKIISHKVASPSHTDDAIVFTRLRRFASPSTPTSCLVRTRVHMPNGISIGSAVFAQLTAQRPYSLQWATPFPHKIASSPEGSGPPSNEWFLGPTRGHNQTGISIGSAVLQG